MVLTSADIWSPPELFEYNPHNHTLIVIDFNIILPLFPGLLNGLFSSDFLTKILYKFYISPIHSTYSAQLILFNLITTTCAQ
jgi:hypothetical protein